jgi:hypothetical protein
LQCSERVLAVLHHGGEVAADGQPRGGACLRPESSGNLLLD